MNNVFMNGLNKCILQALWYRRVVGSTVGDKNEYEPPTPFYYKNNMYSDKFSQQGNNNVRVIGNLQSISTFSYCEFAVDDFIEIDNKKLRIVDISLNKIPTTGYSTIVEKILTLQ